MKIDSIYRQEAIAPDVVSNFSYDTDDNLGKLIDDDFFSMEKDVT